MTCCYAMQRATSYTSPTFGMDKSKHIVAPIDHFPFATTLSKNDEAFGTLVQIIIEMLKPGRKIVVGHFVCDNSDLSIHMSFIVWSFLLGRMLDCF